MNKTIEKILLFYIKTKENNQRKNKTILKYSKPTKN